MFEDEDEENCDINAFDDLEAREPIKSGSAASVFITIYNKYPLNADLYSYSKSLNSEMEKLAKKKVQESSSVRTVPTEL